MDWKGGLVESMGFLLALLAIINGAFTKGGELGLVRLDSWIQDFFGFSIPFIDTIAQNMSNLTLIAIISILLIFKGPTLFTFLRKIFFKA